MLRYDVCEIDLLEQKLKEAAFVVFDSVSEALSGVIGTEGYEPVPCLRDGRRVRRQQVTGVERPTEGRQGSPGNSLARPNQTYPAGA